MDNACFSMYCSECKKSHTVPGDVFGSIDCLLQGQAVKRFVQFDAGVYVLTLVKRSNNVSYLADYVFIGKIVRVQ